MAKETGIGSITTQTIRGSIWAGISSISQRFGGLIFSIILARFLAPEGFGLFSLVLSISIIFAVITEEGIHRALVKYISNSLNRGKIKKASNYFAFIFKLKLFATVIISVLLVLLSYPIAVYLFKRPDMFWLLLLASSFTFISSLDVFFLSLFYPLKEFKFLFYRELLFQLLRITLSLIIFALGLRFYTNLIFLFLVLIITSFLTLCFVFWRVYSKNRKLILTHQNEILSRNKKKEIVAFSIYSTLVTLSFVLWSNIDILMIGYFIDDSSFVGLYKVAVTIAYNVLGLFVFNLVFLSAFSQVKKERLQAAFNKAIRYIMLLVIPAVFGLAVLRDYFLIALFGRDYIQASLPLLIFSIGIVFLVINALFGELFSALNKPKYIFRASLLSFILNSFFSLLILYNYSEKNPLFAITGVAFSTMLSWIFYTVLLFFLARKELNIKLSISNVAFPLIGSIIMAFVVYFSRNLFLKQFSILNGIIIILEGLLVYVCFMILIGALKKEDYTFVKTQFSYVKNHQS